MSHMPVGKRHLGMQTFDSKHITTMTEPGVSASHEIDAIIDALGGWRAQVLATLRGVIHDADPEVVEEIKWRKPSNHRGVPVWSHSGMICTGEAYVDKVKLTFMHGAALPDPVGLFNSSLGGNTRRAMDLFDGDTIDEVAFRALVRDAVAFNES